MSRRLTLAGVDRGVREKPTIVVAWDPEVLTSEEYAELVRALGDLVRARGALGVQRLESMTVGVPSTTLV